MNNNSHKENLTRNVKVLELSLSSKGQQIFEENTVEEDDNADNILEVDQSYSEENVSAVINTAFNKASNFTFAKKILSTNVSEQSSSGSTVLHTSSLPDSLDGGKTEVNDLISLPQNFETALRINQSLQRRFGITLDKLTNALEDNLKRQNQLRHEEEDHGLVVAYDKDSQETREQYIARPSSFSIPYFKDKSGIPAPMNNDAKLKVDQGYLDLYTTKTRTWLCGENILLTKEIQKEWKEQNLKTFSDELQNIEKKIKLTTISEIEKERLEEEKKKLNSKVQYYLNTDEKEIDISKNADLDWDKIAVSAFDGSRSAEDCRLLWENKLHPHIYKDIWKEREDIFIQQYVTSDKSAKCIDWEVVSQKLNTGRTGFQCMQRWVSYIEPTLYPARWTPENSRRLEDTICTLRIGSYIPWTEVTRHLTGITASQAQSRWRNVNPEQARGPFTTEEDFLLIKGLTMFGLNFEMIAHYLPGRSRFQIRDRFKRTLMLGLTSNPWTVREDKKIMATCSMSNQHWRTVAVVFPKRESCEIRVRFYTLHVWQEHSKEKVLPPPLFPLSKTRKLKEIKEIREKLINMHTSCTDLNKCIDKISSNKHMPIKTFEDRRHVIRSIQRSKASKGISEKIPKKPRAKKRKGPQGPKIPNWPDMALTEYFLPGRQEFGLTEIRPEGKEVEEYMSILADGLQLNPTQTMTDDFLEDYHHLNLDEQDAHIIDDLAVEHSHAINENDPNCKACLRLVKNRPISIPLIPPNHSTVGAFRSFLYNKQKLNEMASKEFLFFQVPNDQLSKLGSKPNTLLSQNLKNQEATNSTFSSTSTENEKDTPTKGKRKAAKKANAINLVFSNKGFQEEITRDQTSKGSDCDAIEAPTDQEFRRILTQAELPHLCSRPPPYSTKKKTIAEEDNLLFHRFMGLFFWPALFTLEKPSMNDYHMSENLVEQLKIDQLDEEIAAGNSLNISEPSSFVTSKFKGLEIEEQEELIDIMEHEDKRKEVFYQPLNGAKSNEVKIEDCLEEKKPSRYTAVMRKRSIVKLKRSLIMKKVWDGRRKGICPDRKKRGKMVHNIVQSSLRKRKAGQ